MRTLLTPPGLLGCDPAALAEALNLSHAARTRSDPPETGPGFPRVRVVGGSWCRQNIDGGRWWPIETNELRELLGLEVVA